MQEELEEDCPCTNDCPRHGDCVACFLYHTHKPDPNHVKCLRYENDMSQTLKERVCTRLQAAGIPVKCGAT